MEPRERRAVLALLAAGWLLCFFNGLIEGVTPRSDGKHYFELAESIRLHGRYTLLRRNLDRPYAGYEPLQPLFVAGMNALGGRWVYLAGASTLVSAGFGLWFLAARGWFGASSRLPWLLWLLMLWPNPLYLHARWYRREPLTCLLTAALVLLLTRAWASGRRRDAVLAGVCWGLTILCKSVWMVLPPFLLLAWWRGGRPLPRFLLALGACMLTVAPWTVRNCLVMPSPVLVSSMGGVSFMNNNVHGLDPWLTSYRSVYPESLEEFVADEGAADRAIYRRKIAVLARRPLLTARILLVNLLEFVYPIEGPHYLAQVFHVPPPRLRPPLLFAYAGLLAGLAAGGFRLPPRESPLRILLAMGAAYGGVSLAWVGIPTYWAPVEPLILALGIWGWAYWARGLPGRAAIAAGAYALSWAASAFFTDEVRQPAVEWLCRLLGRAS